MYKLVAFTNSVDSITSEYIKNQLEAIRNSFPDVETEQVNETDARLALYSRIPDRFPCLILFQNDVRKAVIHAKIHDHEAIEWVASKLG